MLTISIDGLTVDGFSAGVARKPRIEFAGAVYHIFNRGKDRQNLFAQAATAEVFERILIETGTRCGWKLGAYCLMNDHYHLALTTPRGNLVAGMQWLQSNFANGCRNHPRLRGEIFENRYRAIVVEPGPDLRRLIDYIHLGPVRGALRSVYNLENYPWSSFHRYFGKSSPPGCLKCDDWLRPADGMKATPEEWENYRNSLVSLMELDPSQRETMFGKIGRGWVLGSQQYRDKLRLKFGELAAERTAGRKSLRDLNEREWERLTADFLTRLGKTPGDVSASRKSAEWKAAVACFLKERTSVTNGWLSQRLNMGPPAMASRLATAFKSLPPGSRSYYDDLLQHQE